LKKEIFLLASSGFKAKSACTSPLLNQGGARANGQQLLLHDAFVDW
jgi:hypothetical protein